MKGLRARRRERRYLGVREIPLDAVDALVGTDGRVGSFTRDFRRSTRSAATLARGGVRRREARPGVRIPVSRPAHYLELLENIQVHGYHRMRDSDACSRTRRLRRTGTTRPESRRSPRSSACALAACTGTRRRATCSSFSTGTGGMRSPRSAARTFRRPSSR
jgi:hypothetical protein